MSDDKRMSSSYQAQEQTTSVTIREIHQMIKLLDEAQKPRVKFDTNMTIMENEAKRITDKKIEDVKTLLSQYNRS